MNSWTCPKCNTTQTLGACENCAVVGETIDRRHNPAEPGRRTFAILEKSTSARPYGQVSAGVTTQLRRRARKATDEILNDPDFDPGLDASRQRLELALAIASELALRKAENGMAIEEDYDNLQKAVNTYRVLVSTKPFNIEDMSETELAATAAGKK